MPVALIIIVVIAIGAATGFIVTRDTGSDEAPAPVAENLPANDGPEPEPELAMTEPGDTPGPTNGTTDGQPLPTLTESDSAIRALPSTPTDSEDPAVSGITELPEPNTEANTSASTYEDGTYTADASYFTPSNTQHDIQVSVTLADDVITDVEVSYDGGNAETPNHARFDAAVSPEVVGVALEDISLSRTGGASLTTEAFNEAVDTIKQNAAA